MVSGYNPGKIEKKWQKVWREKKLFSPDLNTAKNPFYNLMMFPYPSAEGLHVGNMYAFCGSDIYGRFKRMQGNSVFEPIGLDGFGIHSENYAIKVGRHPKEQAKISQKNFYRQLLATGNAYDWERSLETYDADYYKWTQSIFIKLFNAGLAYRKKSAVNFCPADKTVLADEQVIDGKCERCQTQVVKKDLEQWFFKITKYADRLLDNLDKLDWSERVKVAQRNWIGKSEGALIKFQISNFKFQIDVFTTRPDTLFGATFLVLAPEHELVSEILNFKFQISNFKLKAIRNYVERAKKKSELERKEVKDKTGVFTGIYAINPVNNEKIPIWIADYVLESYGTGAIMAVPAHDERDFEFAKRYKLPVKQVITANRGSTPKAQSSPVGVEPVTQVYAGDGTIVNSGQWDGWKAPQDLGKVIDWIEKKRIGRRQTQFHLRDWLISRQRYWGAPIPMIFCKKCATEDKSSFTSTVSKNHQQIRNPKFEIRNFAHEMAGWFPVPEKDLPVLLPDVSDWRPKGEGKSPLANIETFVNTKCPNCGSSAKRETGVSDTFLDSAWYFLRYTSVDKKHVAWDDKRVSRWLPVDMYIGGAEHSVLHLLYSRFLTMVFADLGLVNFEEPFSKFRAHGLLISQGAKMSKSRGNIVNPDDYIAKYGADTLRLYLMFCGRFEQGGDFQDKSIEGISRFLKRVWRLVGVSGTVGQWDGGYKRGLEPNNLQTYQPNDLYLMHKTIKKVTEDIENLSYNTAIAALMEWLNFLERKLEIRTENLELSKQNKLTSQYSSLSTREEVKNFLLLLAPFAPHIAEELWQGVYGVRGPVSSFLPVSAATPQFHSIHL